MRSLVQRILRTMPTVIGCYLALLAFPRSCVSGPVFRESFDRIRGNCLRNFWTEVTFTQNLLSPPDSALLPTWILASDLQLFLASFLWIYWYTLNRRQAMMALFLLPIGCC